MKKIAVILVSLLLITFSSFCQQLKKPPEEKTLVYFVRYQGALALMDFKYFDGEKYLGKASGYSYYVYECEPGKHVFWIAAENREYLKGELKPNCTYVIEVRPYMRAVMAGANLYQISPKDKKAFKKISKVIDRGRLVEMKGQKEDLSSFIDSGMERYKKIESEVQQMNPNWTF